MAATNGEERPRPLCLVDAGDVGSGVGVKSTHQSQRLVELFLGQSLRRLEQKAVQRRVERLHHVLLDVKDSEAMSCASENITEGVFDPLFAVAQANEPFTVVKYVQGRPNHPQEPRQGRRVFVARQFPEPLERFDRSHPEPS